MPTGDHLAQRIDQCRSGRCRRRRKSRLDLVHDHRDTVLRVGRLHLARESSARRDPGPFAFEGRGFSVEQDLTEQIVPVVKRSAGICQAYHSSGGTKARQGLLRISSPLTGADRASTTTSRLVTVSPSSRSGRELRLPSTVPTDSLGRAPRHHSLTDHGKSCRSGHLQDLEGGTDRVRDPEPASESGGSRSVLRPPRHRRSSSRLPA